MSAPRMSGYTHCACRDCFEIVVSRDWLKPDLCDECADGCEGHGPDEYDETDEDVGVSS